MDLSKLSTEDLIALKAKDLSKVSTEGLKYIKSQQTSQPTPSIALPQDEPSSLEAILRGAGQGITAGFSDELVGGVKSLFGDKTYEQYRDESRAANEAARTAHPWLYGGGELGGGIAGTIATGGLAEGALGAVGLGAKAAEAGSALVGASKAIPTAVEAGSVIAEAIPVAKTVGQVAAEGALTGAGFGGLTGAGYSEAGDASGVAQDVGIGALTGGILGAGTSAAGAKLTKLAKENPEFKKLIEYYNYSKQGKQLYKAGATTKIAEEMNSTLDNIKGNYAKTAEDLGKQFGELIESSKNQPIEDALPIIQKIKDRLLELQDKNKNIPTHLKSIDKMLEPINNVLEGTPTTIKTLVTPAKSAEEQIMEKYAGAIKKPGTSIVPVEGSPGTSAIQEMIDHPGTESVKPIKSFKVNPKQTEDMTPSEWMDSVRKASEEANTQANEALLRLEEKSRRAGENATFHIVPSDVVPNEVDIIKRVVTKSENTGVPKTIATATDIPAEYKDITSRIQSDKPPTAGELRSLSNFFKGHTQSFALNPESSFQDLSNTAGGAVKDISSLLSENLGSAELNAKYAAQKQLEDSASFLGTNADRFAMTAQQEKEQLRNSMLGLGREGVSQVDAQARQKIITDQLQKMGVSGTPEYAAKMEDLARQYKLSSDISGGGNIFDTLRAQKQAASLLGANKITSLPIDFAAKMATSPTAAKVVTATGVMAVPQTKASPQAIIQSIVKSNNKSLLPIAKKLQEAEKDNDSFKKIQQEFILKQRPDGQAILKQ